ncbi:LETM1 and EF-hand domain-containing protein 1 mitochondrial, partial [Fasciolopsis buskii]
AIAQLPTSASEEASTRVLESASPTELDPRTKIELLRKEQASIKAARIQRKQELAEQKKAASVSDSKVPKEEKAYSAAKELTDTAPGVNGLSKEWSCFQLIELEVAKGTPSFASMSNTEKSTAQGKSEAAAIGQATPIEPVLPNELQLKEGLQKVLSAKVTKEEEPEITVVELAQIESAIAESSGALHEEALEGLKEEVAETATKHTASLVSTDRTVDKRTTKAAQRLASRLREVHVKHSTEPAEKSQMLDAIKADHERMVDINDLMLALRRLQKVPDDSRWEKILDVLDEDHDGKIELQHVLSVGFNF